MNLFSALTISFICCHSKLKLDFDPYEVIRSRIFLDRFSNVVTFALFFFFFRFRSITLKPGDVILTGTPSGVGMHRKPAEFLAAGDVIESEIESIGKIRNKVIADTL